MEPKDRVILALDVNSIEAAEEAVTALRDHVGAFKIGYELFLSEGPDVVSAVQALGGRVFLDMKFHDIPNTVGAAARAAVRMGVAFFDVHASGGRKMMAEAKKAAVDEAASFGGPPPILLAVTVLTSLSAKDINKDLNISYTPEEQVVSLALTAKAAGMDGVVASPMEVASVREAAGKDFIIVTPGVRPSWAKANDQKRVATPSDALKAGANYLVIGRPILSSKDPVEAAIRIKEELEATIPE